MTQGEDFVAALLRQTDEDFSGRPTGNTVSRTRDDPKLRRLEDLPESLREVRRSAASKNQLVQATVDGTGTVVQIDVHERARRQPHPQLLGTQVMEAVVAARAAAAEVERSALDEFRNRRTSG